MEWIADPTPGEWLRERLNREWGDMHDVVPTGFAAYARVFHPTEVRSLPDRPMPDAREWQRMPQDEHLRLIDQLHDAPARWANAAAAFGTVMHPLAQWQSITRLGADEQTRIAGDGREFGDPPQGQLSAETLAPLAEHLAAHTTTPHDGVAGVWEGYGGLLGGMGTNGRSFFGWAEPHENPNHQAVLNALQSDPFNNPYPKSTWVDGILSREISEGPKLELPGRAYVLFTAPPMAFANPDWVMDAAWRDRPGEAHGFAPSAQHPNLLWPDDRAWVMVSEIDFDSTIVAGSAELVAAICADQRLEARPIPAASSLYDDGDTVNVGGGR